MRYDSLTATTAALPQAQQQQQEKSYRRRSNGRSHAHQCPRHLLTSGGPREESKTGVCQRPLAENHVSATEPQRSRGFVLASLPAHLPLQSSTARGGEPVSLRSPSVALGPAVPDITHALCGGPRGAGRALAVPAAAVSGTPNASLLRGHVPTCPEDVQVQADGRLLTNH